MAGRRSRKLRFFEELRPSVKVGIQLAEHRSSASTWRRKSDVQTFAPAYGRNHAQHLRDEWLQSNRDRVAWKNSTAIGAEMKKRLGLYSPNTSIGDIRVSLAKTCRRLGIGHPRA